MRTHVVASLVAFGLCTLPGRGLAANPLAASLRCRKTVAAAVAQLSSAGLNQIAGCHAKRDKGKTADDCNTLSSGAFLAARTRASARVAALCGRDPYLDRFTTGSIDASILGATRKALEASGRDVEGAPSIVGDKAKLKCHLAIGKARNAVIVAGMRQDTGCQKHLDAGQSTLGGLGTIAPDCLTATNAATSKARAAIAKACTGLTGADVGSCSPLPDCVITSALATIDTLARYAYGPCGDQHIDADAGEECDDGNDVDTDGCVSCLAATCGDGFVQTNVEECDDGNDVDTDACVGCKAARCGDGFVQANVEECDDGNDVAGDGCTNCIADHVTCGDLGMDATVTLVDTVAAAHDIFGLDLDLTYATPLSLPEAGGGPGVTARVTDLSGTAGFSSIFNDQATHTLTDAYVTQRSAIPLSGFARVRFDCPANTTFSPAIVHCVVKDAADSNGILVDVDQLPVCRVDLTPASTGGTTTTTTVPAPSTTTVPPSTTSTSTSTTVPGETTTTTLPAPVCGNNLVEAGETCDDGNTVDGDTCPSNCRIESCSPTAVTRTFSVNVAPPSGVSLGGVTVFVNYPEGKMNLPGHGNDATVQSGITGLPAGAFATPNDLDYGLIEVLASTGTIPAGKLFTMTVADCGGAATAVPGDFTCTVTDAADTSFDTVTGVTCSVVTP